MQYTYKIFSTAYGSGNYNSTTYNGQTQTGTQTGSNSSNGLADTGYDIIIPVALAAALIIAGVILLVKRAGRNKKK